jgi:hypothetical protein
MPPQSNGQQIHLHRFAVPCGVHGRHVYYLAGLDHGADDAALYLLRTLRRNRYQPEYDGTTLDLDTLRAHLFNSAGESDDLPF